MKANVVTDIRQKIDGKPHPPGSIEPRILDNTLVGYGIMCPGCGEEQWIPINNDHPNLRMTGSWRKTGPDDSPTLEPSLFHYVPTCRWHGRLVNGEFINC